MRAPLVSGRSFIYQCKNDFNDEIMQITILRLLFREMGDRKVQRIAVIDYTYKCPVP